MMLTCWARDASKYIRWFMFDTTVVGRTLNVLPTGLTRASELIPRIIQLHSPLIYIHKYLRQFRYSYWWRARHVGVYKPLFMTGKKC